MMVHSYRQYVCQRFSTGGMRTPRGMPAVAKGYAGKNIVAKNIISKNNNQFRFKLSNYKKIDCNIKFMERRSKQQPLKQFNFHSNCLISSFLTYLGVGIGALRLKMSLPLNCPTSHLYVVSLCMVGERVFAGISEPHIPELRKKDGW